jgi:hypothetical protein
MIACTLLCRTSQQLFTRSTTRLRRSGLPVERDTIVFTCALSSAAKLATGVAIVQSVFWGIAATIALDIRDQTNLKSDESAKNAPLAGRRIRYGLCALSLATSAACISVAVFLSTRCVSGVVVKGGGQQIRLNTTSLFGTRHTEVPASTVRVIQPASSNTHTMSMRVQGRRLHFLLDMKNGRILDQRLFDALRLQ